MNKTVVGAAVGAVAALVWILIGGWALITVLVLAAIGGAIGFALDRPGALGELMEKISRR